MHFETDISLCIFFRTQTPTHPLTDYTVLFEDSPVQEKDPQNEDNFSPLKITVEREFRGNTPPTARVICNINYVIAEARELEKHSYECGFGGTYVFEKEKKIRTG